MSKRLIVLGRHSHGANTGMHVRTQRAINNAELVCSLSCPDTYEQACMTIHSHEIETERLLLVLYAHELSHNMVIVTTKCSAYADLEPSDLKGEEFRCSLMQNGCANVQRYMVIAKEIIRDVREGPEWRSSHSPRHRGSARDKQWYRVIGMVPGGSLTNRSVQVIPNLYMNVETSNIRGGQNEAAFGWPKIQVPKRSLGEEVRYQYQTWTEVEGTKILADAEALNQFQSLESEGWSLRQITYPRREPEYLDLGSN
jgi:hypothetical protein